MARSAAIDSLRRDLTQAVRSMRRDPSFAALTIAILGIGIGMATAIATALNAVLLRDLPLLDQDRIVVL